MEQTETVPPFAAVIHACQVSAPIACPEEQGVVQGRKLKSATAGEPVSGGPADSVVHA